MIQDQASRQPVSELERRLDADLMYGSFTVEKITSELKRVGGKRARLQHESKERELQYEEAQRTRKAELHRLRNIIPSGSPTPNDIALSKQEAAIKQAASNEEKAAAKASKELAEVDYRFDLLIIALMLKNSRPSE